MKIAIITGGLGFIGSHLMEEIKDRYEMIVVVDNLSPVVHGTSKVSPNQNIVLVVGNVQDATTWDEVSKKLPNINYSLTVFHLAANTSTGDSLNAPSAHVSTNILGTAALCEFLFKEVENVRKVILTSTRAVYGEGLWTTSKGSIVNPETRQVQDLEKRSWNPKYLDEYCIAPYPVSAAKAIANPVNIYGSTKFSQESILKIWCEAFKVELRIFRLQNVYGPGQSLWNSYSGVISLFAKNALTDQPNEVYEGGGIIRDLVYVKDIAKVLATEIELPDRASVIDVGSGAPTSLHEVASIIARGCSVEAPVISNKFRVGDVRGIYADVSAILRLEIVPEFTSLEVGISELIDWAKVEIESGIVK
jgi:dTDP-L-rhamnose 4-epimerase